MNRVLVQMTAFITTLSPNWGFIQVYAQDAHPCDQLLMTCHQTGRGSQWCHQFDLCMSEFKSISVEQQLHPRERSSVLDAVRRQSRCLHTSAWSVWDSCSATCGWGVRVRKRSSSRPNTPQCPLVETRSCQNQKCPTTSSPTTTTMQPMPTRPRSNLCPNWFWSEWSICSCSNDVTGWRWRLHIHEHTSCPIRHEWGQCLCYETLEHEDSAISLDAESTNTSAVNTTRSPINAPLPQYETQLRRRPSTRAPNYGYCMVSPWTTWSACSNTCGPGAQHRQRHIIPDPAGRPCPAILTNMQDMRKCYFSCGPETILLMQPTTPFLHRVDVSPNDGHIAADVYRRRTGTGIRPPNDNPIGTQLVTVAGSELYAIGTRQADGNGRRVEFFREGFGYWNQDIGTKQDRYFAAIGYAEAEDMLFACGCSNSSNIACIRSCEFRDAQRDGRWTVRQQHRYCFRDAAVVAYKSFMFLSGGAGCQTDVSPKAIQSLIRYDHATDTWTQLADMLERRSGHAAVMVNHRVLVCGGWNGAWFLSSCEWYDTASNTWTRAPSMPRPLKNNRMYLIANRVLSVGGQCCYNAQTQRYMLNNEIYVLDEAGNGQWRTAQARVDNRAELGMMLGTVVPSHWLDL